MLVGALLADRIPIRHVLSGLGAVMAAAIVLLVTGTLVGPFLFDILAAVSWGGGSVVPLAARGIYFGRRQFATIGATSVLVVLPLRILTPFGLVALMGLTVELPSRCCWDWRCVSEGHGRTRWPDRPVWRPHSEHSGTAGPHS